MRDRFLVTSAATANAAIETWYIQNILLEGIPYTLDIELPRIHNSLIIYLELGEISANLIDRARKQGNRLVLFHMGDELGKKNIALYNQCDLIIRNYYFHHIFYDQPFSDKLIWVPNGFRTGVGPRAQSSLKPSTRRNFLASFMGWLSNPRSHNNERAIFSEVAKQCENDLFINASNGFSGGYNLGLYSTIMESSIFSPCPAGNCPDSIRLYEALELGSIPIYLKHPFLDIGDAFGGAPFPLLNEWAELPEFLRQQKSLLASSPDKILDLQKACMEWWQIYNRKKSALISEKLFYLSHK